MMGKPTGLRREQQTVSTDTGAPAASKNNGINSGSDLNTFHNGELKLTFPKAPEMESKCKLLQIFFFFYSSADNGAFVPWMCVPRRRTAVIQITAVACYHILNSVR